MNTSTLNVNQASCLIERPSLSGRTFTNVCTGQETFLPYTPIEIGGGVLMLAFIGFFIFQWCRISGSMRNERHRGF